MTSLLRTSYAALALAALMGGTLPLGAQQPAPPETPPAAPATPAQAAPSEAAAPKQAAAEPPLRRIDEPDAATGSASTSTTVTSDRKERKERNPPFGGFHVGRDARVREAVSILGNTEVEGQVSGDAVAIFGDTRIGPDARVSGNAVAVLGRVDTDGTIEDDAVSVLGGARINGRVGGDAVVVLGDFELGERALVGGDVVVVGGRLNKHPDAVVRGNVVNIPILGGFGDLEWIATWVKRCLLMGRPLAFGAHLGWAWLIAGSFLALYLLFALIFPRGIEKCVTTLETRPGYSLVASVLTVFLSPVVIVLLAVTVVGALVIPFVAMGLFVAKLFGKAVMLAWIGRRFTRSFGSGSFGHPAWAVLCGGAIVLLLYTIPVFGFLLYKVLTWVGLGVVVYTIALTMKREKPVTVGPAPGHPGLDATVPPPPFPAGPQPAAASAPYADSPGSISGVAAGFATSSADYASGPAAAGSTLPPPYSPPRVAVSAATLPRAGFLIRMGALFLDFILIGLLSAFVSGLLPRWFDPEPPSILIVLALYGALMWKARGTTIGGIVCGLKVVRADDRPIDWATSIVRALSCFLSLVVAGLGFLWIAIDDDSQGWHDKIAGTVVVRVPKGVSLV